MIATRWSIEFGDGLRIPVTAIGVVIGRSPECDVVVDDPEVSRKHAHVRVSHRGLELVPLGRNPIDVNRVARTTPVSLEAGDGFVIASLHVTVVASDGDSAEPPAWTIDVGGAQLGLPRPPLVLGGSGQDDVVVPGWPPSAIRIHRVGDALFVEADVDGVTLAGASLTPGSVEAVRDGANLELAGRRAILVYHGVPGSATRPAAVGPERIAIRVLPRGAQVTITMGGVPRSLGVSERRLDLLSILLDPPPPLRRGEFVSDDLILARVWPRSDRADQGDLNALVHRLRRDLIKAGLDGPALIARVPGGGATRFVVGPHTLIDLDRC